MKEQIHKIKDEYVILRFDEGAKDIKQNYKSQYWTGSEWRNGLCYAKRYLFQDSAVDALLKIRINGRRNKPSSSDTEI